MHWVAMEHDHNLRSVDWFWGVGLLALLFCAVAFYFHNYVFGIFILVSAFVLIVMYSTPVKEINIEISQSGIKIGNKNYEFRELKGFSVKENPKEILLVETRKYFMPIITIPLPEHGANTVRANLSIILPELEIEESRSMQFAEKIGL